MKPVTRFKQLLVLGMLTLACAACKEFIEPPITDQSITVNAPADQYQSTSYTLNFWWDDIEDALSYELQIVTPDFANAGTLVTDTTVTTNKFSFQLSPGNYQWRVRAKNGSSQTEWSVVRSFTVVFSSIKQQKVQLKGPSNNLLTNISSLDFSWTSLYGATKYRLQVDSNNFADETQLVLDQTIPGLQLNLLLKKDQSYQWRVRAENDTAQAQWSVINRFAFDHTPPNPVNLTAPGNNQSVRLPALLQWSPSATAVKYELSVFKSDMVTPYSASFPMTLNTNSQAFNQGAFGEQIYWTVAAIDAAGNKSARSPLQSFTLQ